LSEVQAVVEPGPDAPSFLAKMEEAHRIHLSDESQDRRNAFRADITTLRDRFQALLSRNSLVPELEQLARTEFIIDEAGVKELRSQGDLAAAEVFEEVKYDNLGKELVTERIKNQVWDSMHTQGMMLVAFKSGLEVPNFPIQKMSTKEIAMLEKITFARQLELAEQAWHVSQNQPVYSAGPEYSPNDVTYAINVNEGGTGESRYPDEDGGGPALPKATAPGAAGGKSGDTNSTGKSAAAGKAAAAPAPAPAAAAPTSSDKKDDDDDESKPKVPIDVLLYHPMQCFTNQRKMTQAALLRVKIDDIKRDFNAKFKALFDLKQGEIYKFDEKAARLAEINFENRMEEPIFKPSLTLGEQPDHILSVQNSEIQAEYVLSKEERAKQELEEAEAAERARRLREDDSRVRALQDMMGGTLVVRKDAASMEAALVKAEWMKSIPYESMSEEQKTQFQDFEKKERQIRLEMENRKKLLNTELKKIHTDVADACRSFDEKLQVLFTERMEAQKRVSIEELIISKLMCSLLEEEERDAEDIFLTKREVDLTTEKVRQWLLLF
jgi:hypothetical protein